MQILYQKKESREKNYKLGVEQNHQHRQILVLEHQSIPITTQISQNYQRVLQLWGISNNYPEDLPGIVARNRQPRPPTIPMWKKKVDLPGVLAWNHQSRLPIIPM